MANLIVCCDGTWNSQKNHDEGIFAPTNIVKTFNAVDLNSTDVAQKSRYQAGVGTGNGVDKLLGGAFGVGLPEDIRDCYQWLATHYAPGDKIYLFGFSRGAFTARCLAAMIGKFGIVILPSKGREKIVKCIYHEGYRKGKTLQNFSEGMSFFEDSDAVEFLGVWDTVGALGVPDDKALLNLFDNPRKYEFHDVTLGDNVRFARHAISIDEKLGSFTPTLWDADNDEAGRVKQIWFIGTHVDVGGGFNETGLSDISLEWMLNEAAEAGAVFTAGCLDQIKPDYKAPIHHLNIGVLKLLVTAPRNIPDLLSQPALFDPSVMQRRSDPPLAQGTYLPTRTLDLPMAMDIYAKNPWNWTGVYLEAGKSYCFNATGEWVDNNIPASPAGTADNEFHLGELVHVLGSTLGKIEEKFKALIKGEQSNLVLTRRIESAGWMTLMGAVADAENPKVDGTHQMLSYFTIGENLDITIAKSGYLYCFANDAWGFYGNNRGFVTLIMGQYE